MLPLIVTAGMIKKEKKILIAQRKAGNKEYSLKWEFPGGKLEKGEKPEECLIREIKEELNLDIGVEDIFKVVYHNYRDKTILLLCYVCHVTGGDAVPIECNDFKWVHIEELNEFSFVEADKPIVDKIRAKGNKIFEIDG